MLLMLQVYASFTSASAAEAAKPEPIPVTTALLGSVLVFPIRDAPAAAVSVNDTRLDAEITGIVSNISVQVGDRVTRGGGGGRPRLRAAPHRGEAGRGRA